MLPTPVLSVSGKGFARLRISAWHFSPAPPILYAVRAIVYHKSRVLSRVLRDFSGSEAPGTPGAEPARHLLSLPLWRPAGACLACRLPTLPLHSFLPPIPPPPFPGGEGGGLRLFYARGSAPCILGAEPARHWLALPLWKTQRRLAPRGTCSTCPGGEDHLKRRSSSPPVPPLLGCRLCPEKGGSIGFAPNWRLRRYTPAGDMDGRSSQCRRGKPPAGDMDGAGRASAAWVQSRGCKGRSPLHEIT